ncbi:MAG: DUF4388 domain-containing protein [Thermoanaerobaculales bacterium]
MIQGNLDRLHFGDLLEWLQMGGISGRLVLLDDFGQRRLDFLDGRIVYVSSTVPEERLATVLARRKLVPTDELRKILALAILRQTLFTDLLIARSGLAPDELQRNLIDLAEAITSRVLFAPNIRFELDPAYPVRELLGLSLDVEPRHLLLEAARRTDEGPLSTEQEERHDLPFTGEAFESFFWDLVREGFTREEPVDGEGMNALHSLIRDIVGTLAQWLASSPGLVPLPSGQSEGIARDLGREQTIGLFGLPHTTWNQMVLACSLRSSERRRPLKLNHLEAYATELDLWEEMTGSECWRRPHADKLDRLTHRAAVLWSRGAAAAAVPLGVDPETASLAAHLVTVPTDLVLWVLTTLPVPHRHLRQALLRHLPRRVGSSLARLADFPAAIRYLFDPQTPTPLGVCLHLSRENLPSASAWPQTVPRDDDSLLEIASPAALAFAAEAVREALEESPDDQAVNR